MGAATGGVEALIRILARYPTSCPPTLIAQQIQPSFLEALIETLNAAVRPRVKIAEDGEKITAGRVYFAPAEGGHMTLRNNRITMIPEKDPHTRQPSVDYLFESVAREAGPWSVGAILTGMGVDGAEGLLSMRKAGAITFAQTEKSCTVYEMPKIAVAIGAADREVSLDHMANAVLRAATQKDGVVELRSEIVKPATQSEASPPDNQRISDQVSPALRALR
jgi:two-component system chemotaxis response regulator CheB